MCENWDEQEELGEWDLQEMLNEDQKWEDYWWLEE